jgi:DNA mismatch endonuclease, patch repair protein
MRRVKRKDTAPEMVVRSAVHRLGYRFRLHRKDLPGSPDLVFVARKAVIFVNGCFWHHHNGCRRASVPKTRARYWAARLDRNVNRDRRVTRQLRRLGWRVLVIWECETRKPALDLKIRSFLG